MNKFISTETSLRCLSILNYIVASLQRRLHSTIIFRFEASHVIWYQNCASVCGQKMNKLRFVKGFHSILEASRSWWFLSIIGSCYFQTSPAYDSLSVEFFCCVSFELRFFLANIQNRKMVAWRQRMKVMSLWKMKF